MSLIVKVGKKGKKIVKKLITPAEKHNLSYTRRIERIKTDRRICAMTFDDGPMDMPSAPDRFNGRALTDILLDTMAEFGAKGSFDVVGDTGENYPDKAGKVGSAAWGGVKYDHYPDIHCDDKGGAVHNDRLIRRMLAEGHQITNHGYRHIIFGKKPFVYGKREYLGSMDKAVEDLQKLDTLMRDRYGYQISMSRPPHYVDRMQDGFTSYDVYDKLGYQYMAASFDGNGWLPSTHEDPEAALEAEVDAMVEPMRKALEKDPDFFCGQIIFQKDGYNMGKRTPVAFGLRRQLELLREYGYQVVTVETLLAESPFADLGREDPLFEKLNRLQRERAIVYSDNRLRLQDPMTCGELAMLLAPREEALTRRWERIRRSGKHEDAYCGAMDWCVQQGLLAPGAKSGDAVTALPEGLFAPVGDYTRRSVYGAYKVN
jgi:peptidoglycan/xylan/chitin deacetylase (PgdA/CDA1 family)